MFYMNIDEIITEDEYTKERSAKELFGWMSLKDKELSKWNPTAQSREISREIRYRELNKGLPRKFTHELMPFAYFAKDHYGGNSTARFKPFCGSEQFDGIIIDNGTKIFVEVTEAIDGKRSGLQKELLAMGQPAPWEYNILRVKDKKKMETRSVSDIIKTDKSPSRAVIFKKIKKAINVAILKKRNKSRKQTLPYGQNKTILIVTFHSLGAVPLTQKDKWDDFINFKRTEIDSIKHNFKKIIFFDWTDRTFID